MDLLDTHVYGLIRDEGFGRLVAGFYRRVPKDEILGPMYEGRDLAESQWRLDLPAEAVVPLRRFFEDAATFLLNRE